MDSQTDYNEQIAKGLTAAFERAAKDESRLDIKRDRLLLVSDLHKGSRDGADDFWRCERAYHAALGHYFETGHTLVAMGDIEELWECWPKEVLGGYRQTLSLDAKFHAEGRYKRLWGNHDDQWRYPDSVKEHLHPIFPELEVKEALRLRVVDGQEDLGLLFLVHGHQGTSASDKHSGISRLAVRYGWRPLQRLTKRSLNTPATDQALRSRHDRAMFEWAKSWPGNAPLVLIAGHTHHPVFWESWRRPEKELNDELAGWNTNPTANSREDLHAALELVRAEKRWREPPPPPIDPPCYFNTGCCAFADGDVTAIEIAEERIRLVRWLDDENHPSPQTLAEASLREVLLQVEGTTGGADPGKGRIAARSTEPLKP